MNKELEAAYKKLEEAQAEVNRLCEVSEKATQQKRPVVKGQAFRVTWRAEHESIVICEPGIKDDLTSLYIPDDAELDARDYDVLVEPVENFDEANENAPIIFEGDEWGTGLEYAHYRYEINGKIVGE